MPREDAKPKPRRRAHLAKVTRCPTTHPGLWMDVYLFDDADGTKAQTIHEAVAGKTPPDEYDSHFKRVEASFDHLGDRVRRLEATTDGRMVIGLGNKNVLEMGIRLDHTWGVPILPGSSLKGLASSVAHLDSEENTGWNRPGEKKEAGEHHQVLFGTTENSGAVIFHDAWWKPAGRGVPLAQDVMTVHHPDYYQKGDKPASDMDSPTPVSFVTAQGTFLIVLELRPGFDSGWLDVAEQLLRHGLKEYGLGAKTNAGYGRMTIPGGSETPPRAARSNTTDAVAAWRAEAGRVQAGTAAAVIQRLRDDAKLSAAYRKEIADIIAAKLGLKFLKKQAEKAYVQSLNAMRAGTEAGS